MITRFEVEGLMLTHRYLSEEFERRQRRGEFWHAEEITQSLGKARNESPGLQGRILLSIGNFLISLGSSLRQRSRTDSPTAVR